MKYNKLALLDRLEEIYESIDSILWQAIYKMRNIISHEYSNVDEEVVYSVIKDDLQPLKKAIKSIIERTNVTT